MNTHKITFGIATLALLAATASVFAFAGCSGDDSSTPTTRDSGPDSTSDKDGAGKPQKDGGTGDKDSMSGDDASEEAGDDASDANEEGDVSLETPDCGSDSSSC